MHESLDSKIIIVVMSLCDFSYLPQKLQKEHIYTSHEKGVKKALNPFGV